MSWQTKNKCPRVNHKRIRLRGPNGQTAPVRCKSWRQCEVCADENRRRLLAAIAQACRERLGLRIFVTLTLPGKYHRGDLERGWRLIGKMWANLRRRIERRYGRTAFVWVRESHQSGACHLHVLVNRRMAWKWLKQAWQDCGGGWNTNIKAVRAHNAPGYLSKYMSKVDRPTRTEPLPKGVRKYGSGGGLRVSINPRSDGSWRLEAPMPTLTPVSGVYGPLRWEVVSGEAARLAFGHAMRPPDRAGHLFSADWLAFAETAFA